MARFYSARATLDPGKISQWVVEWIEHLDDSHHVFVEFSLPGGRQVDFLLLRESGVYCLEVKDKPYEKVTVNGPWIYRDRSTGCAIEDLNELSENPYGQAKNTADCFRNWLSRKDTAANVFQDRAEKIKRDQYHRFEFLKVFPAVLIPADHPRIEIERDRWCWLCRGTSEITELFKRSWQSSFRITPAEIQRIAETLKLEEVSVLKLVDRSAKGLPRELAGYDAYCRNLIRWLADIDPWHACYVPNPVREAQHPARKSDKPDAEHPQLRTTRDLFPALRHHGRWLIEAEAGVGKTTLCVNICKRAAEEKLSNPDALLPIYVELKDYAPGRLGFPDLIALSLRLCGLDVPGDISPIIEKANLLLLLDGLNEIEERAYPRFLAEARQYLSVMTRSVALMTTRPMHRQRPSLPGLRVIEVSPFGEPQLVDYLQKRDRLDLMEGLARHDINQLLQIPLVMALAVDVGLPFAAAKGLSTGGFFRTLCRDLLHREEQKVGRASAHQMLWDDLAELARQMSADPQLTKGELSKARAIAFMQDRRLDPAVERLQSDLRILIDSRVLRDIVQRDTIAFCHDTIKRFFHAVWLFDASSEDQFEQFMVGATGQYSLWLEHPNLPNYLLSNSIGWHDTLRFLVSFAIESQNDVCRQKILGRLFSTDPLFASSCKELFDHDRGQFATLLSKALGLSNVAEAGAGSVPYSYLPQCKAIMRWSAADSTFVALEGQDAITLLADEVAAQTVIRSGLSELAPLLLERLCRSMKPDRLPYVAAGGFEPWAAGRFEDLIKLCPKPELIKALRRILRTGSVQESRNVAVLLNYWILRAFAEGMGEDVVYVNREICDENGEYVDYENVDSSWAFDELRECIALLKDFTADSPAVWAARELEYELRALGLFEALFVLKPFFDTYPVILAGASTENPEQARERLVRGADKFVNMVSEDKSSARTVAYSELLLWFRGAWQWLGTAEPQFDDTDLELLCWGLCEVTKRNTDMAKRLQMLLDFPDQSIEAATSIVRLYFEGLWTRGQRLRKYLGPRSRQVCSYSDTRPDGTYETREWDYRPFSEFLDLLPCAPLEFRTMEELRLVQMELSLGGPPEFMRAGQILLDHRRLK